MKIHDLDPEMILVKINCSSSSCPRKLEKYLMEFSGIYTVVIDPEKCLVTVWGKVDPVMVLNAIRETGHSAELFSYKKDPMIEDSEKEKNTFGYNDNELELEERKEDWVIIHSNRKHHRDHEIEDYIPPEIDPEICRDPFCRHHRRRPIIITNRVTPPWEGADHPPPPPHHHVSYLENPFDYVHHPRLPPTCGLHFGGGAYSWVQS